MVNQLCGLLFPVCVSDLLLIHSMKVLSGVQEKKRKVSAIHVIPKRDENGLSVLGEFGCRICHDSLRQIIRAILVTVSLRKISHSNKVSCEICLSCFCWLNIICHGFWRTILLCGEVPCRAGKAVILHRSVDFDSWRRWDWEATFGHFFLHLTGTTLSLVFLSWYDLVSVLVILRKCVNTAVDEKLAILFIFPSLVMIACMLKDDFWLRNTHRHVNMSDLVFVCIDAAQFVC